MVHTHLSIPKNSLVVCCKDKTTLFDFNFSSALNPSRIYMSMILICKSLDPWKRSLSMGNNFWVLIIIMSGGGGEGGFARLISSSGEGGRLHLLMKRI